MMSFAKLLAIVAVFTLAVTSTSAFRKFKRSSPFRSSPGFKRFRKRSPFTSSSSFRNANPFENCAASAMYNVTFLNMLTTGHLGSLIPSTGLNFSSLTVVSHSNRVSLFTIRGFASEEVEAIAEKGDNALLLDTLEDLRRDNNGVKSFGGASGITGPGMATSIVVEVDCTHPFITGLSMIAPSPDWIVQINNVNMYSRKGQKFRRRRYGYMIAYDAGTDDGREFTDPSDPSLDLPTLPPKNIAPLVEDETDRLEGRIVGRFFIRKI